VRVDKFTLALMNRRLVLKTIWERGAINKAEIARRTGLSLPTAIKITDELLDNRIVRSCGRQEGASGKRPEMYEFAGDCYYSVGIDFAPTVLRALVMDLNGMPVAKANRPIPVPEDADAVIQTAAELIDQLLRESGIPLHRVLGVGVGVPGILDLDQGRVLFSPNFHWEDVALLEPLGRLLLQRTSIRWPMRLENSNRAMALGEQFFGSGVGYHYFICINLGYGIGAAAIEKAISLSDKYAGTTKRAMTMDKDAFDKFIAESSGDSTFGLGHLSSWSTGDDALKRVFRSRDGDDPDSYNVVLECKSKSGVSIKDVADVDMDEVLYSKKARFKVLDTDPDYSVGKYKAVKLTLEEVGNRGDSSDLDGGPGSGNFGHEGRPGEIGGSAPYLTSTASKLFQR